LTLPTAGCWTVTIWSETSARSFVLESPAIVNFLAVLSEPGRCLIAVSSESTFGRLTTPEGDSLFDVGASGLFLPVVVFQAMDSPTTSQSPTASESATDLLPSSASEKPDGLSAVAIGVVVARAVVLFVGIGIVVILVRRGVLQCGKQKKESSAMLPEPLLTPSETRRPFDQAV
jgi:hypothetical protein